MHLVPKIIPSKGRPSSSLFAKLPDAIIVVEPQDEAIYRSLNPNARILVLPENNRGIAFARHWILEYARTLEPKWFWMIDDDVYQFYEQQENRNVRISPQDALAKAEGLFMKLPNVGLASLEYQQYSWSAKKDFIFNSHCDVCVCINTELTSGVQYRPELMLKEDRDLVMQVVASGVDAVRVCRIGFQCPKNGTKAGGLKPVYETKGAEWAACAVMENLWGPDICRTRVKPNGRTDLKIYWKTLVQRRFVTTSTDSQETQKFDAHTVDENFNSPFIAC